jgi:pimeloyl-ACP methyl ester carboxylesterase
MKKREHLGAWKGVEAEARFRATEDEFWREAFTVQPASSDVETSVGTTRVYRWEGDGEPIVFLHGATGTSVSWWEYVDEFAGRDMYAIDTMGDVGRSVQRVALRDAAQATEWLDETLAGMSCPHAHLVGTSYGGWLALNLAVRRPERVASLTLLDPVGLGRLDLGRFMLWGMCCFGGALLPAPARRKVGVWTRMPLLEDKRMLRWVFYGQRNHRVQLVRPEPLDDDSLRSIAVPTIILLGEKSEVHRSASVAEHVRAVNPSLHVEIVAGAGHALPVSHRELACDRIRSQLEGRVPS